ncbi:hypothetical protein KFZ58_12190 [Virgibacillus sp. NKC19-16]|uniref:hypothetical protein n=1 Tax=Virgibacillus salidurans TaxID=2831673 RepID=UPI001F4299C4|nr:hypothetical protein [Virgibacillus sp. NKC19-16]UJL45171.1 hypothetical protein KFZ58_12190 [Virgibacillus sp. NKC19-16]
MNWPVLKDIKWVAFQLTSILSAVAGVIFAVGSNSYWVLLFLDDIDEFRGSRATKLTQ